MKTTSYYLLKDSTNAAVPWAAGPFKIALCVPSINLQSETAKWTGVCKGKTSETESN